MKHELDPEALASPSCPAPEEPDRVVLAHGAGAGASSRLFETRVWPHLRNPLLAARHDGALFTTPSTRLAFSTDTFVVHPAVFPGGDMGSLAVHGTLNDLAMCGARPLALSCALILEEGTPLDAVETLVASLAAAASEAGVPVATGDTKVVERGKGDGVFINTAGVGFVPEGRELRPDRVAAGDAILVSGPVGSHGAAVLSVREGLTFESEIESDSAHLGPLVEALLDAVPEVHCLRDPTRGGVGAVLHEMATAADAELEIEEVTLPVETAVRAACEVLGLDPLFLASEGRLLAFVPEAKAAAALDAMRDHPSGREAVRIGSVLPGRARVVVRTAYGTRRLLPLPAGEPLPRIC